MIAETTPVLSLLFAKGLGIKTLSGLVDRMLERHLSVDEFAHLSADHLVREFGLRRSVAEGILRFGEKWEVRSLFNNNNHLVLSEFSPRRPWTPQNAMQRNKTICGLSDAMIVIESGMRGGTFAAAEATLKLDRPLFVVEYAQPAASAEGNRYFLQRGAAPLRGNREGQPNLHAFFENLGLSADAAAPDDVAIHPSAATTDSVGERGESYSPNSTVSQANAIGAAHEERMSERGHETAGHVVGRGQGAVVEAGQTGKSD